MGRRMIGGGEVVDMLRYSGMEVVVVVGATSGFIPPKTDSKFNCE